MNIKNITFLILLQIVILYSTTKNIFVIKKFDAHSDYPIYYSSDNYGSTAKICNDTFDCILYSISDIDKYNYISQQRFLLKEKQFKLYLESKFISNIEIFNPNVIVGDLGDIHLVANISLNNCNLTNGKYFLVPKNISIKQNKKYKMDKKTKILKQRFIKNELYYYQQSLLNKNIIFDKNAIKDIYNNSDKTKLVVFYDGQDIYLSRTYKSDLFFGEDSTQYSVIVIFVLFKLNRKIMKIEPNIVLLNAKDGEGWKYLKYYSSFDIDNDGILEIVALESGLDSIFYVIIKKKNNIWYYQD